MDSSYLTWIVFLPVVGAIIIAFISSEHEGAIKRVAAIFTAVPLALSIYLFAIFDRSLSAAGLIQFEEKALWIAPLNAHYHLGVDGLSMPLVLLTAFLGFLSVLISWKIHVRPREYFAWLLLLETSILGVFASLDLLLFFIMWEIEVIPMYFLISIWGSGRREYSAIKYVLYTLFGSAFMLAGILSLYFTTGSLSMLEISNQGLGMVQSIMPAGAIFFLLIIGFAVKLPVFPVHTWLPDAHTDAPTAVSVILAVTGVAGRVVPVFVIIGASFGPICGAMFVDYLMNKRTWTGPRAGFNPAGWIAWAVGFVVGILPNLGVAVPAAPVLAFVAGALVYWLCATGGLLSPVMPLPGSKND